MSTVRHRTVRHRTERANKGQSLNHRSDGHNSSLAHGPNLVPNLTEGILSCFPFSVVLIPKPEDCRETQGSRRNEPERYYHRNPNLGFYLDER
jgi:hypothetical protein